MLTSYDLITQTLFTNAAHKVDVLRLDLVHPEVSGNKWFKLYLNLKAALNQNNNTILTFGGAHSNHIAATAFAAAQMGLNSIGVIRGEANYVNNTTLSRAAEQGMRLHFVDRETYNRKTDPDFLQTLQKNFGDFYLVPEGGYGILGMLGCKAIVAPYPQYDYLFCACGTGTTFAGMMLGKQPHQVLVGINVLKGNNQLVQTTNKILSESGEANTSVVFGNEQLDTEQVAQSCITDYYAFSGYARFDKVLVDFKNSFEKTHGFALDHVYTTKLFYAVFDLMKRNKLKQNSSLLVVHSGGLQGNESFEKRYHDKLSR